MPWNLLEASWNGLARLWDRVYGVELQSPPHNCPLDRARWSRSSRKAAETALLCLRRRSSFPHPCNALLLEFLLEPAPQLATFECDTVGLTSDLFSAFCTHWMLPKRSGIREGSLIFSAQPMTTSEEGRYAELRVDALSGDFRCGILMGVTLRRPGEWELDPPTDITEVPLCTWGLPKCSMPPFKVGALIGYLVTWEGELVLFINGVEVGRARRINLASRADVWLVVDLSHDVMAVTLLDEQPPKDSEPGIFPAARRCTRRSASVMVQYRGWTAEKCRRILIRTISSAIATVRLPFMRHAMNGLHRVNGDEASQQTWHQTRERSFRLN